jgi:AcrR family transcriptional regulator
MSLRDQRKQQSRQALLDAVLKLSTTGRSFSTISLRELTREVGLVPTAFYRHFDDMEQLGQALVAQVSTRLQQILLLLRQGYLKHQDAKTRTSIQLFFRAVDQSPQDWIFLIGERWGGSPAVRQAIAQDIASLTQELSHDLEQSRNFQHVENSQDLAVMSSIIVNLSLTWAMTWLSLTSQYPPDQLKQQQLQYVELAVTQVRLLFRGISHWQSS